MKRDKIFISLVFSILVMILFYNCSDGFWDDIQKVNAFGRWDSNKPTVEVEPKAGSENISSCNHIVLKFSNDMDTESVEDSFSLKKEGSPQGGSFK